MNYSILDFEEYKGQEINNAVLCWNKTSGYFFMSFHSYLMAMCESPVFKVVGVQK